MTPLTPRRKAWMGLFALLAFFTIACRCGLPSFGGAPENPNTAGAEFGTVVTAGAIGEGSAPLDVRSQFSEDEPIIYVVAQVNRLQSGTSLFARWMRDGRAIEDSEPLTADRDYTNTYLNFSLEPVQGSSLESLDPGDYSVQIYINGNPGPKADFEVR